MHAVGQGLTEAFVWNEKDNRRIIKSVRIYHGFRALEIVGNIVANFLTLVMFYNINCSVESFALKAILFIVGRHIIFQVVYRATFVYERRQPFSYLSRPKHWDVFVWDVPYPSVWMYCVGIPVGVLMIILAVFI